MEIKKVGFTNHKDFDMPAVLYKYRSWDKLHHRRLITERELHFACPNTFPDKFDCKIPTRWDLLTNVEILNKYFDNSLRYFSQDDINNRMAFAIDWAEKSEVKNPEIVEQWQKETFEQFDSIFGILSLTEYPTETKMWEEYSNAHTGFCVGFDAREVFKIGKGGGIVVYDEELPIIYPSPRHSFLEQSILQIFCKLNNWKYEKEYRVYLAKGYILSKNDRNVQISSNAVKEILLGALMTTQQQEELISSIPKELSHVKIKKAVLDGDQIFLKDLN